MKTKKSSLLLSFVMIACLVTGCAFGGFDASGYVISSLDANLKGEFDEYAKITGSTVEDVEKLYNDFLDTDLSFIDAYGANDETKTKFRELFISLYKQMKYEVGEATKEDDGSYTVPVTVSKMIVFKPIMDNVEKDMEAWAKDQIAAGTTPSTQEIYDYVLDYMYDGINNALSNPEYADAVTTNIKVSNTSGNVYQMDQNEFQSLLESMIDIEAAQ